MGNTVYHIVLFFLLVTNFLFPSCKEENPCSNFQTPEDFANCPILCGELTDTSIPCFLEVPRYSTGAWGSQHETLLDVIPEEKTPSKYWTLGYWRMGETGKGLVEILLLPFFMGVPQYEMKNNEILRYPTPSNIFPPQIRSSNQTPDPYLSSLTLYFRFYLAHDTCVIELASVMSWRIRDTMDSIFADYQRSTLITEIDGTCEELVNLKEIKPKFAWKTKGRIFRVADWGGATDGYYKFGCEVDGWCNVFCIVDFDCPCHHDGTCDIFTCPGDLDCGCGQDFICFENCENDPDCRCIEDGECDSICGKLDPDCHCEADGLCNCKCLKDDPDCGCSEDAICNSSCGWVDKDCQCISDGICNSFCNNDDPDC